jgi:hypothetical protein
MKVNCCEVINYEKQQSTAVGFSKKGSRKLYRVGIISKN